MSQLKPFYEDGDNKGKPYVESGNLVRRLFVDTALGYLEVASAQGSSLPDDPILPSKHWALSEDKHAIARIVEEYTPPTPSYKMSELKISNSASILHGTGKSSYKIGLRILFPNKLTYSEFILNSSNTFKYYDEKGSVFLGSINESLEVKRTEGGQVYDVKVNLIAVRKSTDDRLTRIQFSDLEGVVNTIEMKSITNSARAGLITLIDAYGNYIYNFRPGDYIKRSETAVIINKLRKYIERMLSQ
jgi:hypothetical protein